MEDLSKEFLQKTEKSKVRFDELTDLISRPESPPAAERISKIALLSSFSSFGKSKILMSSTFCSIKVLRF